MARKSNALVSIQASAVTALNIDTDLAPSLLGIVEQIDQLFTDAQATSLRAFWQIGKHIADVASSPEDYLTDEQKSAHVDPSALLVSIFSPVYSADQLRGAEAFYEKYSTERELQRLLDLRCPENPRWRLSASHVQLLTQIADDDQRSAIEDKCAEEALTAKTLAKELQEIRGKKPGGGRKHQSPKSLKNQLHDLLQHIRRFISRSEALWLGEENVYDEFMNTSSSKREGAPQQHFDEIVEMLTKLSDVVGDHVGMANKVMEALQPAEETEEAEEEESSDSDMAADARRAAAAAAASRRKRNNITR
jgi:hypothetical protein